MTADRSLPELEGPGLDAWRTFLVSHALVTRSLDDELRVEHDLSLAEYDALVQLANAEARTLRMSQLADRVLLSRSGVTRLVDRLVAANLVRRVSCPSDARGSFAVLTDHGIATLRRAASTHLRGVQEHFLSALTEADLAAIARALGRIVERSDAGERVSACASTDDAALGSAGLAVSGQTGSSADPSSVGVGAPDDGAVAAA